MIFLNLFFRILQVRSPPPLGLSSPEKCPFLRRLLIGQTPASSSWVSRRLRSDPSRLVSSTAISFFFDFNFPISEYSTLIQTIESKKFHPAFKRLPFSRDSAHSESIGRSKRLDSKFSPYVTYNGLPTLERLIIGMAKVLDIDSKLTQGTKSSSKGPRGHPPPSQVFYVP